MNAVRQEITFDSAFLKQFLLKLGNEYFTNTELSEKYHKIISNLKDYHKLCIDSSDDIAASYWVQNLKEIFNELGKYDKYQYGQVIELFLKRDILDFFIATDESKFTAYRVKNRNISSINLEIAKCSLFKLLLSNTGSLNNEIVTVTPDEFNNNYHQKKSVLLRNQRSINFEMNEDLAGFQFLKPYLFFANKLQIKDKFLLKDTNHIEILMKIFSLVDVLEEIILWTNYGEDDEKICNEFKETVEMKYKNCQILIKEFKKSHPRRIWTNYSNIELTNTFNSIKTCKNGWEAGDAINFNCTIL
jgi:hypothetical protein